MIIRNNSSHQRAPGALDQTDEQPAGAARVVLADDHPLVLNGLRALLRSEPGVEVVAAAPDGAIALELIRAHEPHMAVLDINMPRLSGLDVLEALEQDDLATRVVLLTGTASDEQIATAVERGAWGLLLKEHALDTLIQCLKTVAAGQRWLPGELVASAVRRAAERREKDVQLERVLTAREYEIAGLVAQGLSNKHIARALAISEGTVKIHLHNTYEKLGGVNRTSLAVLMQHAQVGPVAKFENGH
jgi:two-component system, NarL family, nitrate/nitrite response regulator NarL